MLPGTAIEQKSNQLHYQTQKARAKGPGILLTGKPFLLYLPRNKAAVEHAASSGRPFLSLSGTVEDLRSELQTPSSRLALEDHTLGSNYCTRARGHRCQWSSPFRLDNVLTTALFQTTDRIPVFLACLPPLSPSLSPRICVFRLSA